MSSRFDEFPNDEENDMRLFDWIEQAQMTSKPLLEIIVIICCSADGLLRFWLKTLSCNCNAALRTAIALRLSALESI